MKLTVLPGDGIGPEIVRQAVKVLKVIAAAEGFSLTLDYQKIGGDAIDAVGNPLPEETVQSCLHSDAVLLGAVGGPKWDALPGDQRPERGILGIRAALGLYANLRPAKIFPALRDTSPLKESIVAAGVDLLVVRELTGDVYFGEHRLETRDGEPSAFDEMRYSQHEVERIARVAGAAAMKRQKRLVCVDKSNVLESSRLFRRVTGQVIEKEFPEIALTYMYVDNAAMQLVQNPAFFDVMVTSNLFGDILSDEASTLTGSIGMLPSASLGSSGLGLYEPIHGSAPDIAGQGIANPLATILSAAMMLTHTFGREDLAAVIEAAVENSLDVLRTPDLMRGAQGSGLRLATTDEVGDYVAEAIKQAITPISQ